MDASKPQIAEHHGDAGETHQAAGHGHPVLTTNQGVPVADDQNSLRAGPRGPTLLEDFALLEKIHHFDHERIPERVVHARGTGAHGFFEVTNSLKDVCKADLFQTVGERTPVFVRFSTVAGNRGSSDMARDVRGFATKFYTKQGIWDLVGNNIPVFFIQDAIKFPDIIHAVKEEPDRGFPQAQSAHDTFWDFVSLTPESMHMVMWVMSDRAIPRSLRMMEGFGVHTFRLIDAAGKSTYVKFHWKPKQGMMSVVWDEALKISGFDPDFHRRDLYNAIEAGDFPEWELGVQLFDENFATSFDFDVLDATKLIPEEIVPVRTVGRLVLDRNPADVFSETEQVAFCTSHVVPGIDFTNDPLLQGRNFSYLDTQLKRLGSPNFAQIPINAPRCPMHNFQRDGHMQMHQLKPARVSYEPSGLDADGPREAPKTGYVSARVAEAGDKLRVRSETFADHYSQARQFFRSQMPPEQDHIVAALTFELSKVETATVRVRVLSRLAHIDEALAQRVAAGLGHAGPIEQAPATAKRKELPPSKALSILANAVPTLKGRMVGCLVSEGADRALVEALRDGVTKAGGMFKVVAPRIGGVEGGGKRIEADFQLAGGPSVLFDAVALVVSPEGAPALAREAAARAFVADAFAHLKVIAHTEAASALLAGAGAAHADEGLVKLDRASVGRFLERAAAGRVWAREQEVRQVH